MLRPSQQLLAKQRQGLTGYQITQVKDRLALGESPESIAVDFLVRVECVVGIGKERTRHV